MKFWHLSDVCLSLFDGGAAIGAEGAAATAADQAEVGTTGEAKARSAAAGRDKSGEEHVIYGKQAQQTVTDKHVQTQASAPAAEESEQNPTEALEAKRKAFMAMVSGDGQYKEQFDEQVQRIVDRRFKQTKTLEKQLRDNQPLIELLQQRYGIDDADPARLIAAVENDSTFFADAADEAGMSVEQYRQLQNLKVKNAQLLRQQQQRMEDERANAQLQKWYGEAEQVKTLYPSFNLAEESKNPQFLSMLRVGVPVQHAYEVVHMDDIKAGVAQRTQKQVVDGIRAKGVRPKENGTAAQSGFIVRDDVSKLSRNDRAEIARRVARGEMISF